MIDKTSPIHEGLIVHDRLNQRPAFITLRKQKDWIDHDLQLNERTIDLSG